MQKVLKKNRGIGQQGMILITALMVVALIALFLAFQLRWIQLHIQALHQQQRQLRAFQDLERAALLLVEGKRDWPKACLRTTEQDPRVLIRDLSAGSGCVFQQPNRSDPHPFRYLIEDLGKFPCVRVVAGEKNFGTQHWRLTLLLPWDERPRIVQLRWVRPASEAPCEQGRVVYVRTGVISWREVGGGEGGEGGKVVRW